MASGCPECKRLKITKLLLAITINVFEVCNNIDAPNYLQYMEKVGEVKGLCNGDKCVEVRYDDGQV